MRDLTVAKLSNMAFDWLSVLLSANLKPCLNIFVS